MIRYGLICDKDHEFEAWFRSNDDFSAQQERGLVSCPFCNSTQVRKALMAPSVSTSRSKSQPVALALSEEQKKAVVELQRIARQVRDNSEYVGDRFAEEARKIHFGEAEARGVYGQATKEEARSLVEDGIQFMPLPPLPEDQN